MLTTTLSPPFLPLAEQAVLDFDEWLECLARIGYSKYSAIKQMDPSMKVKSLLQNFFGEMTEEDCMRQGTYIRAVRYDLGDSVPLKDESPEEHAAFLAEFKQLDLSGLYGFPLWEAEVHDLLHANFRELASIFRGYCKSLGEGSSDESAKTMDLEEFHDFVIDVGLETKLTTNKAAEPAVYTFEQMKEQFTRADKSGKGLAGPAANSELVLYEFLNVITRVSFHRLNPEYGELTMEHQDTLLPVPQCLDRTLRECILPKAHRDDAAEFRAKAMQQPEVQAALQEGRQRLQSWYATIPLDDNQKVGITQWVSTLQALNVIGTFTCTQGSDIVGDDRVGTEFKCRLSVPQAKAAFVNAQKETGGSVEVRCLSFLPPLPPLVVPAPTTCYPYPWLRPFPSRLGLSFWSQGMFDKWPNAPLRCLATAPPCPWVARQRVYSGACQGRGWGSSSPPPVCRLLPRF